MMSIMILPPIVLTYEGPAIALAGVAQQLLQH